MIQIREGRPDDVAVIVKFQLAMARETEGINLDQATVNQGVSAVFEDSGKGRYFVAESESKVIASLMITYEWSDWRNANMCWIQSVYVEPAFRRKGIYSEMYRHNIQKLVKENINLTGIRLYVDSGNLPAHKVYERLGMDGAHYRLFEWMKQT